MKEELELFTSLSHQLSRLEQMVELVMRRQDDMSRQLASREDIKGLEEEFETKLEALRMAVQVIHYHFDGRN